MRTIKIMFLSILLLAPHATHTSFLHNWSKDIPTETKVSGLICGLALMAFIPLRIDSSAQRRIQQEMELSLRKVAETMRRNRTLAGY